MTPRDRATTIFDCGSFLCDLVNALNDAKRARGVRPRYPQPDWHRALAKACERDDSRRVVAYQRQLDLTMCRTPIYRAYLGDEAAPKMNGHVLRTVASEVELESLDLRGVGAWSERHPGRKWTQWSD